MSEGITITMTAEEWERIISAADCGLADLDQEAMRRTMPLVQALEAGLAAQKRTGGQP